MDHGRTKDQDPSAQGRPSLFTCYTNVKSGLELPPLDFAISHNDVAGVLAVLQAGADPHLRSGRDGDRLPLRSAFDEPTPPRPRPNQVTILRLLLKHGADPNARWCPELTRSADASARSNCFSAGGSTGLHAAARRDRADLAEALLEAGAGVTIEDWMGGTPIERASGRAVFDLLLTAQFPDPGTRATQALKYFSSRHPHDYLRGPWEETPLARALVNVAGERGRPGLAALLLELGADPNQRLTWGGVDWMPLALAIARVSPTGNVIETLLVHGANPNMRWCVAVSLRSLGGFGPVPGCELERGMTIDDGGATRRRRRDHNALAIWSGTGATDWRDWTASDYAPPDRQHDVRVALLAPRTKAQGPPWTKDRPRTKP